MSATARRTAAAVAGFAVATALVGPGSLAGTTLVQGRIASDQRSTLADGLSSVSVGFERNTGRASATTGGGFFVVGGLLPGTRDRAKMLGLAFEDFVGRTFYAGAQPVLGENQLLVERTSLDRWADLLNDGTLDGDGSLDETLGVIFGEVRDSVGSPVPGATVALAPDAGTIVYMADGGDPDPLLTATGATGRFLVLDVPPAEVTVTASVAGVPSGTVYGEVIADTVSGLSPEPGPSLSGSALDETGAAVAGAAIAWDFDVSVATATDGAGAYTLTGAADGLDVTLQGSAPGYRPALTFRLRSEEVPDLSAMNVGFLSDTAYAAYPAAFGVVQAPSLGMVLGRVLGRDGSPLAGATVSVDPQVGTFGYFDAAGAPAPGLLRTSSSGLFALFNIPLGNVVLSAVGPGETIRRVVAPSDAGSVARGDLRGTASITVHGRIVDEQFRTNTLAGAVVSIVEYPELSTIAGPAGDYTLAGVPAGELVTFKAGRIGFKDSYSFMGRTPATDIECTRADCLCPDPDCDPEVTPGCDTSCLEGKKLFAISEPSFSNLYLNAGSVANRSHGLVAVGVILSNGTGALGLTGQLTPTSGAIRYGNDNRFGSKFINTLGAAQVLNADAVVSGFAVFDPRNDEATLELARVFADSVTLNDSFRLDCDAGSGDAFTNLYPCNGARFIPRAKDAFFQWDLGSNERAQVQLATDPAFSTVLLTSATGGGKRFLHRGYWHAADRIWKKIKKLAPSGSPVYWRVLGRDENDVETMTAPYVFYLP